MARPILVLSDLHFGEGDSLLGVRGDDEARDAAARQRIKALCDWVRAQGPLQALILLGDIWDLWTASFQDARREGTTALHALSDLPAEHVIFIPGNHDHHLLVQHQLLDQITALADDRDFGPLAVTQRSYEHSFLAPLMAPAARQRFLVTYPDYHLEYAGRHFVFHHGHHTVILREGRGIFNLVPRLILQRLEGIPIAHITRSDVELASQIFFETMYTVSQSVRTRQRLNRAWDRWLSVSRRFGGGWRGFLRRLRLVSSETVRGTSVFDVEHFRRPVERALQLSAVEQGGHYPCDFYIFGHTHRAGIIVHEGTAVGDVTVVNSGCWLYEPVKDNRQNEGTFVFIDPDHVGLYFQSPDSEIILRAAIPLTPSDV